MYGMHYTIAYLSLIRNTILFVFNFAINVIVFFLNMHGIYIFLHVWICLLGIVCTKSLRYL